MDSNWAEENLRTIRVLMERSALYRRALAPVMFAAGTFGSIGAVAGYALNFSRPVAFLLFWVIVAGLTFASTLLLVRRQARAAGEDFWSPPTRRVANALLPPFLCGLILAVGTGLKAVGVSPNSSEEAGVTLLFWLVPAWVILYGCALHSAGQIISRGMQRFGFFLAVLGALVLIAPVPNIEPNLYFHLLMGGVFGVGHLACGVHLSLTEKPANLP